MSDYNVTTDFSVKDGLAVDDPEKLILGSDLDVEFDALAVAITTKYDSSDIATQVQAEAGTSNAVLMTPLRVAQQLGDSGGGGAGIVGDIIGLADPDADRILFWDDSESAGAFLTVGAGLTLSTTNLTADDANIDHDSLNNFVANEHIDHTGVTLTFQEGIQWSSGGTDISASATGKLDFSGLTQETTLDTANDLAVFYDNSASAHRKIPLENLIGTALGDGRWTKSTTTTLTVDNQITIVYNTAQYDALERGTFSTVAGTYTVGAASTRIYIVANANITAPQNTAAELVVQVDGVTKLRSAQSLSAGTGGSEVSVTVAGNLSLSTGEVVRIQVLTGGGASAATTPIKAGVDNYVSIIELG